MTTRPSFRPDEWPELIKTQDEIVRLWKVGRGPDALELWRSLTPPQQEGVAFSLASLVVHLEVQQKRPGLN